MTKTSPDIKQLATEFSKELAWVLTEVELAEVVKRNAEEPDSGICHSHDFTDANQAMLDVFERHGMDIAGEGGVEQYGSMWNQAWAQAKSDNFGYSENAGERADLEHIREVNTWNSGGNVILDLITLKDGSLLAISEEAIVLYPDMAALENGDTSASVILR